ncbi:MAG: tetratricopeptide repeat protein [Roseiarcus sp.]
MRARALVLALALLSPASGALAAEAGDYAPENIERTYSRMGWLCMIPAFCPVTGKVRAVIRRAMTGDPAGADLLGLTLVVGDGLPRDEEAGVAWIARAAELGDPDAARDIADRLRNGASIEVDETRIAAALKARADRGDAEAMRALGPMIIGGRGARQNPAEGLNLLKRAAELGSSGAESDLSRLYLLGAPGVPADRPAARMWLAASASHGDLDAMNTLGYMGFNAPGERNVAEGFCWLMRASLLDYARAQEELSMILARGESDDHGATIPIDLVQADLWFRLAARSPYHDNAQIRAMIEPQMTTEQLAEAKRLFAAWRPRTIQELKTIAIPLPPMTPGGASPRKCPAMS